MDHVQLVPFAHALPFDLIFPLFPLRSSWSSEKKNLMIYTHFNISLFTAYLPH